MELALLRGAHSETSIIEAIGGRLIAWKQLHSLRRLTCQRRVQIRAARRHGPGRSIGGQRGFDHGVVFRRQHRAGGIQQPPAWAQQRQAALQQPPLRWRQSASMSPRAAQQPDIGMTADHARARAGRIQQDAVERPSIPPARARHTGLRAPASPCAAVAGGSAPRAAAASPSMSTAVSSIAPSAASSSAPVLPPGAAQASSTRSPGAQLSSAAGQLRTGVLHRHQSLHRSRAAASRPRACRAPARSAAQATCARRHALLPQRAQVRFARRCGCRSTRSVIGGCALLAATICAPVIRPGARAAQLEQPGRMGAAPRPVGLRTVALQLLALAQITPQQRIDHGRGARLTQHAAPHPPPRTP